MTNFQSYICDLFSVISISVKDLFTLANINRTVLDYRKAIRCVPFLKAGWTLQTEQTATEARALESDSSA